jgi:hypothetical protein
MTKATRQALERVDQILHEAGWDQPPSQGGLAHRLANPKELEKQFGAERVRQLVALLSQDPPSGEALRDILAQMAGTGHPGTSERDRGE